MPKFNIEDFELPTHFSKKVTNAIANGTLAEETNRLAFIGEVVSFFEAILPNPSGKEYEAISRKIAEKHPGLQDVRNSKYWVSLTPLIQVLTLALDINIVSFQTVFSEQADHSKIQKQQEARTRLEYRRARVQCFIAKCDCSQDRRQ